MHKYEIDKELKHWGILNMHWGIRRFQNPDGSLTPAGRERYGVGPARGTDADRLSRNEMREMSKWYREQKDFYKSKNDYLYELQKYEQNTAHKKGPVRKFIENTFGKALSNYLTTSTEFGFYMLGASFLDATGSKYANDYINWVFHKKGNNNNNNNNNNNSNNHHP